MGSLHLYIKLGHLTHSKQLDTYSLGERALAKNAQSPRFDLSTNEPGTCSTITWQVEAGKPKVQSHPWAQTKFKTNLSQIQYCLKKENGLDLHAGVVFISGKKKNIMTCRQWFLRSEHRHQKKNRRKRLQTIKTEFQMTTYRW